MNKVGSLPNWLNDLTEMLQKKNNEITAVNVQNLPTVDWEGETFYVKFNDGTATLYNKFATAVKEIDECSSIEDVDAFLNANTVTASASEEIIEGTSDAVKDANEEASTPEAQEAGDELAKELEEIMQEEDTPATDEQVSIEQPEEVTLPNYTEEINALKDEMKALTDTVKALSEQVSALVQPEDNEVLSKVNALEEKYAELYRAYTAPANDAYDLNSQEEEMKHVNENIELSQKIIDKEHELDLSKQEDRGKLNADFLKEILDDVKECISDAAEETIEVAKDIVEETEQSECCECENGECTCEDIPAEECDIILLETPEGIEEFTKQICPFCHKETLEASDMEDDKINVKCSNCSKEFSVDSVTNQIFCKK